MEIRLDDIENEYLRNLLIEHRNDMLKHSPPESAHALEVGSIKQQNIAFWTAWKNEELLGCVALKKLSDDHAEIKSMKTKNEHLRKGVATKLLRYLLIEARRLAYTRLSLETGSMEVFNPAIQLYTSFGFIYCNPFSDYVEDPHSVFMTKKI